jgi:hypothetical protein
MNLNPLELVRTVVAKLTADEAEEEAAKDAIVDEVAITIANGKLPKEADMKQLKNSGRTKDLAPAVEAEIKRREYRRIIEAAGDVEGDEARLAASQTARRERLLAIRRQEIEDERKESEELSRLHVRRAQRDDARIKLAEAATKEKKAAAAARRGEKINRRIQFLKEQLGQMGGKDVRLGLGPDGDPLWGDSVVYRLQMLRREIGELTRLRDSASRNNRPTGEIDEERRTKEARLAALETEEAGYRNELSELTEQLERTQSDAAALLE